jgi:hypothetical protein
MVAAVIAMTCGNAGMIILVSGKGNTKTERWEQEPQTISAFYSPTGNGINGRRTEPVRGSSG